MSALTASRMQREERWSLKKFTLASGQKAFKGGIACIDTSTGTVKPGIVSTTLKRIGNFNEDVDATSGALPVNVRLDKEWVVARFANDVAGTPVVAANIGSTCFILDDHTLSGSSGTSTRSVAGLVVDVDATLPADFAVGIVALNTF